MKFTSTLNWIIQGAATVAHLLSLATDAVPPKYRGIVVALAGLAQAVAGIKAHQVNPDGTPAEVSYVPKDGE